MKRMKALLSVVLAVVLMAAVLTGCGKKENKEETIAETTAETKADTEAEDMELLTGKHHIEINIKDMGTIKCELDADIAPITVTNFINLINDNFYEEATIYRVINNFMMQGGAPRDLAMMDTIQKIKGEFASNGWENNLKHERGVISMARAQDPNSGSSQFFICHADRPHLDGEYAAFGVVTEGMEIVDAICENTPVQDRNGYVATPDQPVIENMVVID